MTVLWPHQEKVYSTQAPILHIGGSRVSVMPLGWYFFSVSLCLIILDFGMNYGRFFLYLCSHYSARLATSPYHFIFWYCFLPFILMKTSIRESKYSEMFSLISITLCLILVHIHNKIIRKEGLVASLLQCILQFSPKSKTYKLYM